jgi:superfamily I DNA/RNA helicase
MSGWLVTREELTPDQFRIVELSCQDNKVVQGGPGSGKTIVLLHRARYLADKYNVSPDKFHIFVFTRVLKNYIKSALDYLELPEQCVSTVDAWCYHFYRNNISPTVPKSRGSKGTDYASLRNEVHAFILDNPKYQGILDFIMVDEGQDLEDISLRILNLISRHATLFFDHKQQLYSHGSEEQTILKSLSVNKRNFSLLSVYRCSPYIVNIAAEFINDSKEKELFIRQTSVAQSERETPLLYKARDVEDEKKRIVKALKTRLAKNERIAMLFPQKRQVFGYANAFADMGIEVEVPARRNDPKYIAHDFSSSRPKLMPYHSAKGLTFDSVFLPRLQDNAFFRQAEDTLRRLIFVGITRAKSWVFMSSVNNQSFVLGSVFRNLEQKKHLRIEINASMLDLLNPQENKQSKIGETKDPQDDDPFGDFL